MPGEFYISKQADDHRYLCFGDPSGRADGDDDKTDFGPLNRICSMHCQQRIPLDGGTGERHPEYTSNGHIAVNAVLTSIAFTIVVGNSLLTRDCFWVTMSRPDTCVGMSLCGGHMKQISVRRVLKGQDGKRMIREDVSSESSHSDAVCDFILGCSNAGAGPTSLEISDGRAMWNILDGHAARPGLVTVAGRPGALIYMYNDSNGTECALTVDESVVIDSILLHFGLPKSVRVSTLGCRLTSPVGDDSGWSNPGMDEQVKSSLRVHLLGPLTSIVFQFIGHHTVDMGNVSAVFPPGYAEYRTRFVDQVRSYGTPAGVYAPDTHQMWCRWLMCCQEFRFLFNLEDRPLPFEEGRYRWRESCILSVAQPDVDPRSGKITVDRMFLVYLWRQGLLPDNLFPAEFGVDPRAIKDVRFSFINSITIYV